MNTNVSPVSGFPNMYDSITNIFMKNTPLFLIVITFILVGYYMLFSSLGQTREIYRLTQGTETSFDFTFIELLLWGLFIFLISINGLQYFFSLDIQTAIRNIFTEPEIEIIIKEDGEEELPEIMIEKQVFNIPENTYTYNDAKALCKAYGARLANYSEVEKAYKDGAQWCNYGWSDNQMILFPTQKETYDKLQKIEGHENDCGRPGVNGGYIANPNARFGVNCYGYKPEITQEEREKMGQITPYPLTQKEKEMNAKVNKYKNKLHEIMVSPFNNNKWSQI
jgi:hypothetical protein